MDRLNYTSKREKGKHLNYEERIKMAHCKMNLQ